MPVPVVIRSMEENRRRFKEAMKEPLDSESIAQGLASAARELTTHTFDFKSGLRLVCSRQNRHVDRRHEYNFARALNVSAQILPDSPLWLEVSTMPHHAQDFFRQTAVDTFREMSGLSQELELEGECMVHGTFHWLMKPDPYVEPQHANPSSTGRGTEDL